MAKSGHVLKILLTHFADGMDMTYKRTRGIQEGSKGFGLDSWRENVGTD